MLNSGQKVVHHLTTSIIKALYCYVVIAEIGFHPIVLDRLLRENKHETRCIRLMRVPLTGY